MLERFTRHARAAVYAARAEAIRRGDSRIGTEHLLVGLLDAGGDGVAPLRALGPTADDIRARIAAHVSPDDDLDADALATLGIDLDAVRRAAEEQFGDGALEATTRRRRGRPHVTRRAKKSLELAVRAAQRGHEPSITSARLLLGILDEGGGLAVTVLTEAGVDLERLRRDLDASSSGGRAA